MSHKQGIRFELAPDPRQAILMGRHAGLSRVVENFCLETVRKRWSQRKAEESYGITGDDLTKVPWSAPALEKEWRAAHAERFPWFDENKLSSRVPKEACRMRAAGFANYLKSRQGTRKGPRVGFPSWRKRKHGSRFRYDADRAKPVAPRTVRLPAIGDVAVCEDMYWLTSRIATGQARILAATIREQAGRWWISFQIEVDRDDTNQRHQADTEAPACGIDLGLKTFAVIRNDDGSREEIHAPKPLKAAQRALRRANRKLARAVENSNNWAKARRRVAALHLRVADRRRDFLHKATTRLTRTKSAIAVETLNVNGMVKTAGLPAPSPMPGSASSSASSATRPTGTARTSGRPTAGSPARRRAGTAAGSTVPWFSRTGPECVPDAACCTTVTTTQQATSSPRCSPPQALDMRTLAGKFPGEEKRLVETA
ncbi:RNA-guided endonuclease InsQ/TnpB family protein [Streptomyces gilvosporeus]|uniref:RNA-guided endonuclease InsQ/TnpB family protein n=1 Tax=Streptomyces gilvosporeus TaxID=553510 RepID=UPI001939E242|nr:RNA-guided endonuclease TnpB family protein [Streptomyces gilvosporeus]